MKRSKWIILVVLLVAASFIAGVKAAEGERRVIKNISEATTYVNPPKNARVTLLLEASEFDAPNASVSVSEFLPGAGVPKHAHADGDEILYLLSGKGTCIIEGKNYEVKKGDVLHLKKEREHSFKVTGKEPVKVVQIYAPGGPEQRFKKWDKEKK